MKLQPKKCKYFYLTLLYPILRPILASRYWTRLLLQQNYIQDLLNHIHRWGIHLINSEQMTYYDHSLNVLSSGQQRIISE